MDDLETLTHQGPTVNLYHYATPGGLIGILNSRTLWATSHLHLNDRKEYKIANRLLREEIEKSNLKSQHRRALLTLVRRAQQESFILSLSEDGDLLSQWRAYCPGGNGYSVGFAPDNPIYSSAKQNAFNLIRCIYSEKMQRALTRELISSFDGEYIRSAIPDDVPGTLRVFFERYQWWYSLLVVSSAFKHEGFAEEREWRFVSQYPENLIRDLEYRSGRFGVTPYFKLPLAPKGQEPRVDRAVIGPNANRAAARSALTLLSRTAKFPIAEIHVSRTPLRQ